MDRRRPRLRCQKARLSELQTKDESTLTPFLFVAIKKSATLCLT
jgi:hypothetical protein